jgi:hypothetical protein
MIVYVIFIIYNWYVIYIYIFNYVTYNINSYIIIYLYVICDKACVILFSTSPGEVAAAIWAEAEAPEAPEARKRGPSRSCLWGEIKTGLVDVTLW